MLEMDREERLERRLRRAESLSRRLVLLVGRDDLRGVQEPAQSLFLRDTQGHVSQIRVDSAGSLVANRIDRKDR